jgi:hypothetical protein
MRRTARLTTSTPWKGTETPVGFIVACPNEGDQLAGVVFYLEDGRLFSKAVPGVANR